MMEPPRTAGRTTSRPGSVRWTRICGQSSHILHAGAQPNKQPVKNTERDSAFDGVPKVRLTPGRPALPVKFLVACLTGIVNIICRHCCLPRAGSVRLQTAAATHVDGECMWKYMCGSHRFVSTVRLRAQNQLQWS